MPATPRLLIGIDVGGTKALAGLVNDDLEVLATSRRPTSGVDGGHLIDLLVEEVDELRAQAPGEIVAVGLGIPGLLDRQGRVWKAPNLPLEPGTAIGQELASRIGLLVASDNDANCAAIAEHAAGAGVGHEDLVLLTVGTGVGGGVIVHDEPLRGAHGMAAELGHLTIHADGRPCIGDCPNLGCLEAEASGTALGRIAGEVADEHPGGALAGERQGGTLDGPRVTELAQAGDTEAIEALRRLGVNLGVGMASLGNIFDPGLILVGGGASAAGELLLGPARETFMARVMPPIAERTEVRLARFGNEAGLLGAAVLARRAADGTAGRAAVARP
ncbi:MAG: ROK family protein [Solirubrobacteraceae bacterium]|nr:ROK family protein [Solirubrobacteraceae bacterium]